MAVSHVAPTTLNGNGQLHLQLPPVSRKQFLRGLQPRVADIEDEVRELRIRLTAIEAQPAPANADPTSDAQLRLVLVKVIVEMLLHPGPRGSRRRPAAAH